MDDLWTWTLDFAMARFLSYDGLPVPPPEAVCGNGILESGEECDDGNTTDADGCSAICEIEEDRDADGLPDASFDWCVNVGGAQNFLSKPAPKLSVKGINNAATPVRYKSLSFSGEVQMPTGFRFSEFDPTAPDGGAERGGVEFVLKTEMSRRMHVVLVDPYAGPGTSGWLKVAATWTYLDPAGSNTGITKMTIADRSTVAPGRVRVSVSGRDGELAHPLGAADLPLEAIVVLGRTGGAALRGECGESDFSPRECKLNASGTTLACKKR